MLAKLLQRDSPWKVSKESVQEFIAALAAAGFIIVKADQRQANHLTIHEPL